MSVEDNASTHVGNIAELMQAFLDALPDPVFIKDENMNLIYGNAALDRFILKTTGLLNYLGRPDRDIYPQEQWEVFEREDRKVLAHGISFSEEKIGPEMTALTKKLPVTLPSGKIGIAGINFDITAYKQAEARARETEAANNAKSQFLAAMSHEIRTPLNGILGMAQSLMSDPELTPAQHEKVDILLDSGRTLLSLVDDVLDLSKIEAGKLGIDAVDGDLRHAVGRVTRLFEPRAREKGISLEVVVEEPFNSALCFDPVRVRQCLSNLISNAIKFTDKGQVRVRVATQPEDEQWRVTIDVCDSGIGISQDALSRLFTDFSQADSSTTRRFGGTGLGLAITRRLARMMGGDVVGQSLPHQGSSFTLTFLAGAATSQGSMAPTLSKADIPAASLTGLRVLLADDNRVNREVVKLFLTPYDARIIEAENGQQVLDALARDAFDILLLDVHMPVMDGMEALSILRASDAPYRDIPVIALTADAMAGDRERFLSKGANGYVTKPIDQGDLLSAIARLNVRPDPGDVSTDPLLDLLAGLERREPHKASPNDTLPALRQEWLTSTHTQLRGLICALDGDDATETPAVHRIAHDCQGQGPFFGFELFGFIASDLCFILRSRSGPMNEEMRVLTGRYVHALLYLLEKGISGTGGPSGSALRLKLAA
ncbi:MAG: response regulator [Alphaproteobacteria bacterium]|nr:response regulator [Alphaproteobacteria bacterium]MBU2085690.1 response regulator [Alphaproteobacteria bacterium]MBU2141625.1 response regulator [Alphaproteobacteria bacterium]MBU2197589.1 response regulator [Alphaproteobacteria bacterium]